MAPRGCCVRPARGPWLACAGLAAADAPADRRDRPAPGHAAPAARAAARGARTSAYAAVRSARPIRPRHQHHRKPLLGLRRRFHPGRPGRPARSADHRLPGRSPRPDRDAAQQPGQGEPVLPARLQPRPRHRLRRLRGRRALQPAHQRPRPGLPRPELRHPGTHRPRRFPQGAVLRRRRRLLLDRLRVDPPARPDALRHRQDRNRHVRLGARRRRQLREGRPRRPALRRRGQLLQRGLPAQGELQPLGRRPQVHHRRPDRRRLAVVLVHRLRRLRKLRQSDSAAGYAGRPARQSASRTRRTSSPPRATPSTPSTSTGATTAR